MDSLTVLRRWRSASAFFAIATAAVIGCEWLVSVGTNAGLSNADTTWHLLQKVTGGIRALSALSLLSTLLAAAALSAFIGLSYRCRLSLNRAGRGPSMSPAWALWSWLVPGLNLLLPPVFVADLMARGEPDAEEGGQASAPIRLVWAGWVVGIGYLAYEAYWTFARREGTGSARQMLLDAAEPAGAQLRSSARTSVARVWQLAPNPWMLALLTVALVLHLAVIGQLMRRCRTT